MPVDQDVLQQLCGLAPGEFVAARDARSRDLKAAGRGEDAQAVKALRRPPLALWALNQLPRLHPALVQAWLALVARMKHAHREALTEGAAELREASRQQREVLATLVDHAEELSPGVGSRVREMLQALVSSEDDLRARFHLGILTDEPQAGDVSDVLSLMLAAGAPRLPVATPATGPADELHVRRETLKRQAEEERARKAAEERDREAKVAALQAAIAGAQGEREVAAALAVEHRSRADAAMALAADAEAQARKMALAAREADAAAHQARLALEAVERRLRELAADLVKAGGTRP
jgi:hypothetical protein